MICNPLMLMPLSTPSFLRHESLKGCKWSVTRVQTCNPSPERLPGPWDDCSWQAQWFNVTRLLRLIPEYGCYAHPITRM